MGDADQNLPCAVHQIRELIAWVGEGRALTKLGRLTRADARTLVGLLDTGDEVDYVSDGKLHRMRSSNDLPHLMLVLEWARVAGLVRVFKGRLVPVRQRRSIASDPALLTAHLFATIAGNNFRVKTIRGSLITIDYEFAFDALTESLHHSGVQGIRVPTVSEAVWDEVVPRWNTDYISDAELRDWRRGHEVHVQILIDCLVSIGVARIDGDTIRLTATGQGLLSRHQAEHRWLSL